jgi:hypothetical protein
MLKTVCDCCGAETFKQDLFLDTNIDILGRKVTLCPECLETVKKECDDAENSIRNAVRAASREAISSVFRRFEALNTVELFGNDNAVTLKDSDIDATIKRILSKVDTPIRASAINFNSNAITTQLGGGIQSAWSNLPGISINKDLLKDTVSEILNEIKECNESLHSINIKPDDV